MSPSEPPANPDMSDRRRVWITGIGADHADRHRPSTPSGPASAPAARRSSGSTASIPSPFRTPGRRPGRRLRPARLDAAEDRPPARPVQPVRARGRPARPRRRRAAARRGRRARRRDRIGIYLGSALGGIAYAEEQHERYLERGIKAVAPNLALAVFGGAAPANLGIALDVRGPILSTANSCASGAVALGEALGAIRAGEIDAAIAGGVEIPLSPLAFGAFDIIRALSAGSNDDPAHACRPFDADRDGFVMGEGATLLVLEAEDVARARGAEPYAELWATGRPRTPTTWSSRGPTAGRPPGPPRWPWPTPASTPARSTRSAPTRARRRSATSPRRGRSRWRWATAPRPCRSAGRRRCTATRSVRRARSRPRSARSRSATAGCRRRRTSSSRTRTIAALLPGLLRDRPRRHLPPGPVDLVRVRRAERRRCHRRNRRISGEA